MALDRPSPGWAGPCGPARPPLRRVGVAGGVEGQHELGRPTEARGAVRSSGGAPPADNVLIIW